MIFRSGSSSKWLFVLIASVLLGIMAVSIRTAHSDSRLSVPELAAAIREGRIAHGMTFPAGTLPKPWVSTVYHSSDFTVLSSLNCFRDHQYIILLYCQGDLLFAACVIEQSPAWTEKWHFYDNDAMSAHVERSIAQSTRDP